MALAELVLEDQYQEDDGLPVNSEFIGVPIVYTEGFKRTFGNDYLIIAQAALDLLVEQYPQKDWKYFQEYYYKGTEFWVISDAIQGRQSENDHITFLMPYEY